MDLLIKAARVVDFSQDFVGDVYIENGIISEIGRDLKKQCSIIDGRGKILMPSFIDTHCHFRDPGFTYKEDIYTGSRAAVRGGYTGVNLMANTNPVCSTIETVDYVLNKGKEVGLIDIHQCTSITHDFDGQSINHLDRLSPKVRIITEDGKDVMDVKVMMEAMFKAKKKDITVMCHCEDHALSNEDMRLAENMMTWRNVTLAEYTGCRAHIAHVSTKESIDYCIEAKKKGHKVTLEVTPHHIALTRDNIDYRVNPPIRNEEDRLHIIKAIQEGYVDAIGTDHAPHTPEDKKKGAPGLSGIETSFSVCYTELVKKGYIDLCRLSEIMSKRPAEIVGFNKGQIKIGFDGDLVLVDLDSEYKINAEEFHSKGKNTPFHDRWVSGRVITTIKAGKIVFQEGEA